jgi:hypothetical protein
MIDTFGTNSEGRSLGITACFDSDITGLPSFERSLGVQVDLGHSNSINAWLGQP